MHIAAVLADAKQFFFALVYGFNPCARAHPSPETINYLLFHQFVLSNKTRIAIRVVGCWLTRNRG